MIHILKFNESIKDDSIKADQYDKYLHKLVVYIHKHDNYTTVNFGVVKKIYLSDNFQTNLYIITIQVNNNPHFPTSFRLEDIDIIKECESLEQAKEEVQEIRTQNKFNL